MEEIRIWINDEDSINFITNVGVESIENAVKKFKHNLTLETGDLNTYLKGYFGDAITIIPREVTEIEFNEL